MTEFGHWTDMARRAVCRLLRRQPTLQKVIDDMINREDWTPGEIDMPLFFNAVTLPESASIVSIEYKAPDGTWHKLDDQNERGTKALDLLREMLAGFPDPWIENDYVGVFCFFCGASKERLHETDCTYLKAIELLKGE